MFTKNWYKAIATSATRIAIPFVNAHNKSFNTGNTVDALAYGTTSNNNYAPVLSRVIKDDITANFSTSGVAFGDGNIAPTIDDITLSGNCIRTLTHTCSVTNTADEDGVTTTALYTLTNTGTEDITISEVGLFAKLSTTSSDTYKYMALVERTLLDEPVTIPAGGVGQITYTIRMNYPAA